MFSSFLFNPSNVIVELRYSTQLLNTLTSPSNRVKNLALSYEFAKSS